MFPSAKELLEALEGKWPFPEASFSQDQVSELLNTFRDKILYEFVDRLVSQVDQIIDINPELEEKQILVRAAQNIVEFLKAQCASIRIYDPELEEMQSYGSFRHMEEQRQPYVSLEDSVVGEVIRTQKSYVVPNLLKEDKYKEKEIIQRLGVNSMLAVPLELPRFSPKEPDTNGVIQIYYKEKDKIFSKLEIVVAEALARRVSHVIMRKRVQTLYKLNEKKEKIIEKIYVKLGQKEGIKMKEVFKMVIPELSDLMNIQSCALFSVSEDGQSALLEAGYPEIDSYHGVGKRFSLKDEPYFDIIVNHSNNVGESAYEKIEHNYILIHDPQRSHILTQRLKDFAAIHNINSILYIPMRVEGVVKYFMAFDALDQQKSFSPEDIEIFSLLGRELMKAHRLEMLDDILHDFKNPAIATAGFARRAKRLLEEGRYDDRRDDVKRSLDIVVDETMRLQELALTLNGVGKEKVVNLTEKLLRRFEINEQAIKEQRRSNIELIKKDLQTDLYVKCYPLQLERVFDNLLNNATNAIPEEGGELIIRSFRDGDWACAEIINTGEIPEEDREKLIEGEGKGRGLHITYRLIRSMRGRVNVRTFNKRTIFVVKIPIYQSEIADES